MKNIYKYLFIVVGSVLSLGLLFNVITPFICKHMPNQFAKADLVLDSLKSEKFKPEIIAVGSSLVQTGINGHILRKELNNSKVYNLAVPGFTLKQVCGYLPFLPSTVKTVILGVRIDDLVTNERNYKTSTIQDSLFKTYISARLATENKNIIKENFKNRACLQAGLQIMITDILDNDAPGEESMNIIYPYLYPSNRVVSAYQRELTRRNKEGDIMIDGKILNTDYLELLKQTKGYLKKKNINFIVYLSPSSPDLNFTMQEKTKLFITSLEQNLPHDLDFVNCFYLLQAEDFYDSVHPNRLGADKLSNILAEHILQQQKNDTK